MKNKKDLVLVHSFPTNSVLLSGLKDYLDDYFTVHFVDLPGFHKDNPPLKGAITIKKFSDFLEKKIEDLNLKEYVVGGISFGFLVVNNAKLDKNCKAILAMEPYLNIECLNMTFWERKKYILISFILKGMHYFKMENSIWKSKWFASYLQKESDSPKERVSMIIKHIDCHTFFTVMKILLSYTKQPKFHELPYFLIGNFADKTINFDSVVEIFIKNLREIHIASEPIDHYPKNLTKDYFRIRIPAEHISRVIGCMNGEL